MDFYTGKPTTREREKDRGDPWDSIHTPRRSAAFSPLPPPMHLHIPWNVYSALSLFIADVEIAHAYSRAECRPGFPLPRKYVGRVSRADTLERRRVCSVIEIANSLPTPSPAEPAIEQAVRWNATVEANSSLYVTTNFSSLSFFLSLGDGSHSCIYVCTVAIPSSSSSSARLCTSQTHATRRASRSTKRQPSVWWPRIISALHYTSFFRVRHRAPVKSACMYARVYLPLKHSL